MSDASADMAKLVIALAIVMSDASAMSDASEKHFVISNIYFINHV